MENIKRQNKIGEKCRKMTLKGYFNAIPTHNSPRKEFVRKVALRCGVTEQTVRNWCIYGMRPINYNNVKVLSAMTGIPEEDLWE